MKLFKTGISVVLAVMFAIASVPIATSNVSLRNDVQSVSAETPSTYSTKDYVPKKANTVDYWGGVSEMEGGGISTFAHAGLSVPLKGDAIEIDTEFSLLSSMATTEGGDEIDGWLTYSFSSSPAVAGNDKSYPYYGSEGYGYYLQIKNVSGTTAPNCAQVQLIEKGNGTILREFFLDNAIGVPITLSLKKQDDGLYDLTFTRKSDGAVLKKQEDITLNDTLFMSGTGQTYLSTAIYEGSGCDGNHGAHRWLKVYSMKAHTLDVPESAVSLSQNVYDYVQGNTYTPTVSVNVDGITASDYTVSYANNSQAGTASAIVKFTDNTYAGNVITKNFTIRNIATVKFVADGTEVSSATYGTTDSVTMPDKAKTGYVLVGWEQDGKLYPVGGSIALNAEANATVTFNAVYVEFESQNGAAVRLSEPYGIRFRGYFSKTLIDTIADYEGVEITFGSKITSEGSTKFVDIVGEQAKLYEDEKAGCYYFNTALVNIKTTNFERVYYSTPYITIKYSDGTTKTFEATKTDGRTYKQVIDAAYADVSDTQQGAYIYEVKKDGVTCYAKISAGAFAKLTTIYNSLNAEEVVE